MLALIFRSSESVIKHIGFVQFALKNLEPFSIEQLLRPQNWFLPTSVYRECWIWFFLKPIICSLIARPGKQAQFILVKFHLQYL